MKLRTYTGCLTLRYLPSKMFKNYHGHHKYPPELNDYSNPQLGFSGITQPWSDYPLDDVNYNCVVVDWTSPASHCIEPSNIEARVIGAQLHLNDFIIGFNRDWKFTRMNKNEQRACQHTLETQFHHLNDLQSYYGRMSRRRQKNLDHLQSQQVSKTHKCLPVSIDDKTGKPTEFDP